MSSIQDFLKGARDTSEDPREFLRKLEECEFREEAEIKAARAWWDARYYFADKKKKRVGDRFLWFLLNLSSWTNTSALGDKQLVKAYEETFLSPEIEQAMALGDNLEAELYDACTQYIDTMNPKTVILGVSAGKALTKDETRRRIASNVAGKLIPGVYLRCGQFAYADVLIRCLWRGAEAVYPGITPALAAVVGSYDGTDMREFVMRAIRG